MAQLQLKELPISERPVERLWRLETPALSTGELLEILVGDADATVGQRILVHFGGLWKLSRAGLTDKAIVQAGELLDIDVLDHLIIGTSPCYISLRARGLGFDGGPRNSSWRKFA